jgi:hypothetical protein
MVFMARTNNFLPKFADKNGVGKGGFHHSRSVRGLPIILQKFGEKTPIIRGVNGRSYPHVQKFTPHP